MPDHPTSEVERFVNSELAMHPKSNGQWVRFEDYERLAKAYDALQQKAQDAARFAEGENQRLLRERDRAIETRENANAASAREQLRAETAERLLVDVREELERRAAEAQRLLDKAVSASLARANEEAVALFTAASSTCNDLQDLQVAQPTRSRDDD